MPHAVVWAGAAKWVSQLVSWASTILVVRPLTPEDFGLVGMAQIFVSLVTIFTEFGLTAAIIAHPELTEEQIGQLNTVSVIVSTVAVLITCAAAAPLGRFFMAPQLPLVVMATGSVFAISGFRIVPNAHLQRELRFRYLAIAESIPSIVEPLLWEPRGKSIVGLTARLAASDDIHPDLRPRERFLTSPRPFLLLDGLGNRLIRAWTDECQVCDANPVRDARAVASQLPSTGGEGDTHGCLRRPRDRAHLDRHARPFVRR